MIVKEGNCQKELTLLLAAGGTKARDEGTTTKQL